MHNIIHGNIKLELWKLSWWQTSIEDSIELWGVGFEQLQSFTTLST